MHLFVSVPPAIRPTNSSTRTIRLALAHLTQEARNE